jgi:hypothetical protein
MVRDCHSDEMVPYPSDPSETMRLISDYRLPT